jgi:hypothetical protein
MIYVKVDGERFALQEEAIKQADIAWVDAIPCCEHCQHDLVPMQAYVSADSRGTIIVCGCERDGGYYLVTVKDAEGTRPFMLPEDWDKST